MNISEKSAVITEVFAELYESLTDNSSSMEVDAYGANLSIFTAEGITNGLALLHNAFLQATEDGLPIGDWS